MITVSVTLTKPSFLSKSGQEEKELQPASYYRALVASDFFHRPFYTFDFYSDSLPKIRVFYLGDKFSMVKIPK